MARTRTPPTPASKIAIGYIRVSTDEQALGPEAQRTALETWCKTNGYTLAVVSEDIGVSGGTPIDKRPGLLKAVEAVREHGAAVLLAAKRDRLARDVIIAAMIERLVEKTGARVLTAAGAGNGDGPEALLMRGMMDVFAQYERALIRSRTVAGLAVKRRRGERIGQIPFGFALASDGVRLEKEATEQAVLARIIALRDDGLSIRSIANQLNTDGVPARGMRWYPTTVARLVKRAA